VTDGRRHVQLAVLRELGCSLDVCSSRHLVAKMFALNPETPEQVTLTDVKALFRSIMFEQSCQVVCSSPSVHGFVHGLLPA
jgi:hypothetical protein